MITCYSSSLKDRHGKNDAHVFARKNHVLILKIILLHGVIQGETLEKGLDSALHRQIKFHLSSFSRRPRLHHRYRFYNATVE